MIDSQTYEYLIAFDIRVHIIYHVLDNDSFDRKRRITYRSTVSPKYTIMESAKGDAQA